MNISRNIGGLGLEESVKVNPLATEKVERLILKFSIPAIISMLVSSLYNIVDQIFIGQGVGTSLEMQRLISHFQLRLFVLQRHCFLGLEVLQILICPRGQESRNVRAGMQGQDL